jgi:hypothetical protein
MTKLKLQFIGKPIYRWMWGKRYISNKTAWILINVIHIAEVEE